jgi:hypothetical protein
VGTRASLRTRRDPFKAASITCHRFPESLRSIESRATRARQAKSRRRRPLGARRRTSGQILSQQCPHLLCVLKVRVERHADLRQRRQLVHSDFQIVRYRMTGKNRDGAVKNRCFNHKECGLDFTI